MYSKEFGVKIGEYHTYRDWGIILTDYNISPPEPRLNLVDVPGRDGSLDYSQVVSGEVRYNNRTIKLTFYVPSPEKWRHVVSCIQNQIQGARTKIIVDDDLGYYYYGRVYVDDFSNSGRIGTMVIIADVNPYKYDINISDEDWEWDIFDFEQGIINETKDISVSGTTTVNVISAVSSEDITVISDSNMTLEVAETTLNIKVGSNVILSKYVKKGDNIFKFTGNGTVTIRHRGRSL